MNIALLIDGKDVAAAGGATYDRHDPISGTVATRAAAASVADANAAADAAAAAFPAWAATSPKPASGAAAECGRRSWRRAPMPSSRR